MAASPHRPSVRRWKSRGVPAEASRDSTRPSAGVARAVRNTGAYDIYEILFGRV